MAIILPGGSSLSTVGPGDVPIVAFLFKGNRYPHWRLAFSRQFIINRKHPDDGYPLSAVGVPLPVPKCYR